MNCGYHYMVIETLDATVAKSDAYELCDARMLHKDLLSVPQKNYLLIRPAKNLTVRTNWLT